VSRNPLDDWARHQELVKLLKEIRDRLPPRPSGTMTILPFPDWNAILSGARAEVRSPLTPREEATSPLKAPARKKRTR
jgi:hypothetical protein